MTNKKFTDEEIIEALDLCTQQNGSIPCYDCPCWNNDEQECKGIDYTATHDLINRQKAEIEDLKVELAAMRGAANSFKAEVERLKDYNSNLIDGNTALSNEVLVSKAKAEVEAYEEFAEKLKEEWFCNGYDSPDVDFDDFIVNLLKEMVGEKK